MLNFLIEEEIEENINEFHQRICGGHRAWRATAYKILIVGYYWLSFFSDVNYMVRAFVECHMFAGK